MLLKDITLASPEENILLDDVLLSLAESGQCGEVLRFWESPMDFIVLGRISNIRDDIKTDAVSRDGVPILRRFSGGGTVLQGEGCLNYAVILSKEKTPRLNDLRKSYIYIFEKITAAFKKENVEISFRPPSDLVIGPDEKKFSGNAQRRSRKFILQHGTILFDFSIEKIEAYLNIPKEMPFYRKSRPHSAFLENISLRPERIKLLFADAFGITKKENVLTKGQEECLNEFKKNKAGKVCIRI